MLHFPFLQQDVKPLLPQHASVSWNVLRASRARSSKRILRYWMGEEFWEGEDNVSRGTADRFLLGWHLATLYIYAQASWEPLDFARSKNRHTTRPTSWELIFSQLHRSESLRSTSLCIQRTITAMTDNTQQPFQATSVCKIEFWSSWT